MKLSELSTDRAADALCELAPYVANIIEDEEIISALDRAMPKKPDGEEPTGGEKNEEEKVRANRSDGFATGLRMFGEIGRMAPVLLKTHRPDVYGILSVMNERPAAEIAAQKLTETMRQVKELFRDGEFVAFFKSSVRQDETAQSAPSASSPASE